MKEAQKFLLDKSLNDLVINNPYTADDAVYVSEVMQMYLDDNYVKQEEIAKIAFEASYHAYSAAKKERLYTPDWNKATGVTKSRYRKIAKAIHSRIKGEK